MERKYVCSTCLLHRKPQYTPTTDASYYQELGMLDRACETSWSKGVNSPEQSEAFSGEVHFDFGSECQADQDSQTNGWRRGPQSKESMSLPSSDLC